MAKKKAGAVFVDLTAAYDTVWHRGLTSKLLRLLPDRHMVHMIMEMVGNHCFTLVTGNAKGAGYDVSRTALKVIFTHGKTKKLWVDKGRRFCNKHVKELSVELYSTENKEKYSVVEHWDRTMKKRMYKFFTANDTQKYNDVLDKFVKKCNTTRHSSIQMTPVEASKKENELTVFINLYPFERLPSKPAKFAIGDKSESARRKGSLR